MACRQYFSVCPALNTHTPTMPFSEIATIRQTQAQNPKISSILVMPDEKEQVTLIWLN